MTEYKINFRSIANNLIPYFLRNNAFIHWIYSLIKPMSDLNDNGVKVVSFGQKNTSFFRFLSFMQDWIKYNGQVRTMEYYLNNIWTTATWPYNQANGGIYIFYAGFQRNYIFNFKENIVQRFYYNNYESTTTYQINEYAAFKGKVYKCIQQSINNSPDVLNSLYWVYLTDNNFVYSSYLYNNGESLASFIIYVPTGLTGWDENKFKAQLGQYKLAGKSYIIIYY